MISATIAPVSQWASRSGTSSSRSAAASCGVPAAATSWKRVLNGRNCRPVIRVELAGRHVGEHLVHDPVRCGRRGSAPGCRAGTPSGRAARSRRPRCRCRRSRSCRRARPGRAQTVEHPAVQAQHVPVQGARRPAPGRWGSGCCLLQLQPLGPDPAEHHPAAGRAEIDRGDVRGRIVRSLVSVPMGARPQRRNAAATPESTGTCRPVVRDRSPAGQGEDGVGDVVGQHLALEQGPLGVVLAEFLLGDAVDGGPFGAPAAGEDPGAADDAVGVDPVDPDLVLAELGGEQPHLVGLVGLGGAVGDVVRARRTASSCWRCRRCPRPSPARS